MNNHLIKQLQEGKIAVHNDGTLEELRKVLQYAFPEDPFNKMTNGIAKYYQANNNHFWRGTDKTDLPSYSVKEFLKEEFILPERWCITRLLPQAEIKIVSDYINDRFNLSFSTNPSKDSKYYIDELNNTIDYGMCFESKTVEYKKPYSHYTEITFEQFKKYVLKEKTMENNIKLGTTFYHKDNKDLIYTISSFDGNNVEISWGNMGRLQYSLDSVLNNIKDRTWIITMEKKIIGYKLIKPEYKEAAVKIGKWSSIEQFEKLEDGCNLTIKGYHYDLLKDAGVLDLWFEPVYEEEKFNVGDYITVVENNNTTYNGIVGETYKIIKIVGEFFFYYENNCINTNNVKVRKATEEEIKKAQSIEIGGYEVKFLNKEACVINGIQYLKTHLEVLKYLIDKGQIKSLNVGCSGQYKVDLELL